MGLPVNFTSTLSNFIIIIHFLTPGLYRNGDFLTFYYSVRRFYSDISQLYIISNLLLFDIFQ